MSIVTKAWEHIERIGGRAHWAPHAVLVTGAGPIGLLAALAGVQRGYETHVLDRATDGPKPDLVHRLGAAYHTGTVGSLGFGPDIILECTGASEVIVGVIDAIAPAGIVALTGVSSDGQPTVDIGRASRTMVLDNIVVFGTVNANRRHWCDAASALAQADPEWLGALITRRLPLAQFAQALAPAASDVKVVLDLTS